MSWCVPFSRFLHPTIPWCVLSSHSRRAEQRRRCANSVDAAPPNDVFMRTVCIARMRWNALQYTPLVRVVVGRKLLISLSVERCNCVCVCVYAPLLRNTTRSLWAVTFSSPLSTHILTTRCNSGWSSYDVLDVDQPLCTLVCAMFVCVCVRACKIL